MTKALKILLPVLLANAFLYLGTLRLGHDAILFHGVAREA